MNLFLACLLQPRFFEFKLKCLKGWLSVESRQGLRTLGLNVGMQLAEETNATLSHNRLIFFASIRQQIFTGVLILWNEIKILHLFHKLRTSQVDAKSRIL